jgi:hypothetical protein
VVATAMGKIAMRARGRVGSGGALPLEGTVRVRTVIRRVHNS